MQHTGWYKNRVFYQIFPRSFRDANGDGIGDLYGVYEKLDYIRALGCDGIRFSPLCPSGVTDCGITNETDIAPEYGGMKAFRMLLDGAHYRGMKVILDLVINRTGKEHPWFQMSRKRVAPYTDYYIWRPAKKDGTPPGSRGSHLEGKVWTFDPVRKEYYLSVASQPNLNMDNPRVREEIKRILRFWLDMGVDGFCEDIRFPSPSAQIHEYLTEFQRDVLSHYDCITIGEAPLASPRRALDYIREDGGQLDMLFPCDDSLHAKFSLRRLKRAFSIWQHVLRGKAWNMLCLESHNQLRIVSRCESEAFREASAKMLAAAYLFRQGTPFVYQGQELGMTNGHPSRSGARTPMQWTDEIHAGFTTGIPWLPVNPNYTRLNAAAQEADPYSVLNFYRRAIDLRKVIPCVQDGAYREYNRLSKDFYIYSRSSDSQRLLVICSFSPTEAVPRLPPSFDILSGYLLLCNYPGSTSTAFHPYETRVYFWR